MNKLIKKMPSSPSSRRAWIEIWFLSSCFVVVWVALLAEGVDRNPTSRDRNI